MSESPSLASQIGRASVIIILWSVADKILAVGKEMLTAHRFGVSASLDVFNLAQSFPGITILLFTATLAPALVPLYLEWRTQSAGEADSHATWLIYLASLFFAVLALICFFFSPEIIRLIGYGFQAGEKSLAVAMERLLVLLIFLDGVGILFRGVLHARKCFAHLYIAPIFVNFTLVFLLIFDMGLDIYLLVWGFLIGTLLKTVYMGIALKREGFRYGLSSPLDPQRVKAFLLLAIPMFGSSLIANSNLMVDHVMATQLPAGSLSTLRYALRIHDLPIQVVIATISIAIFPFISENVASGNRQNLRGIFKYALIFLGFLTIPNTCLMILFSEDLVVLLLKRGAFDMAAARQTAETLVCYSLGLFFYGYTFINGSFFIALQKAKVLFYMGIFSVFLNTGLNFLFMHWIGVRGIALSTSVTMFIISLYFIYLLKLRLGIGDFSEILSSFSRMILAAVCMLGTGFLLFWLFPMVTAERWVSLPITLVLVCLTYLGVVWLFRTEDLNACWQASVGLLRPLIGGKKSP